MFTSKSVSFYQVARLVTRPRLESRRRPPGLVPSFFGVRSLKSASQSRNRFAAKPNVLTLDRREQPGSLLSSGLDVSVLLGGSLLSPEMTHPVLHPATQTQANQAV